jgi:hypothetical protein
MSEERCPHCSCELPLVRDAFCGACGEPLDEAPGVPATAEVGHPRQLADFFPGGRLAHYFPGGSAASLVLTVGQIVAVLAGILALIGIFNGLAALDQLRQMGGAVQEGAAFFVVANGVVQILLSAAMFVVFGRAKATASAAKHQDAENQQIAQSLAALQSRLDSIKIESPPSEHQ